MRDERWRIMFEGSNPECELAGNLAGNVTLLSVVLCTSLCPPCIPPVGVSSRRSRQSPACKCSQPMYLDNPTHLANAIILMLQRMTTEISRQMSRTLWSRSKTCLMVPTLTKRPHSEADLLTRFYQSGYK